MAFNIYQKQVLFGHNVFEENAMVTVIFEFLFLKTHS